MKDQLYILKPGFFNKEEGPFYCGDSVPVEGFISFFPEVRSLIDVHHIGFTRPRSPIAETLGEENQSLPVIVLATDTVMKDATLAPSVSKGTRFFNDQALIRRYLSSQFGLPHAG